MMRFFNSSGWSGLWALIATLVITAWAVNAAAEQAEEKQAASLGKSQSTSPIHTVNMNSADAKALESLPGIGAALAQRIIDGRPYRSLDDLGKIKGLSKAKLAALKDAVTFGSARPSAESTAAREKAPKLATDTEPPARESTAPAVREQPQRTISAASPGATQHSASKPWPGHKININKATADELDNLPGIGPAKAKAIVDYRTQNGNFKTIEEIEKVRGIKGGLFAKFKDHIKVSD